MKLHYTRMWTLYFCAKNGLNSSANHSVFVIMSDAFTLREHWCWSMLDSNPFFMNSNSYRFPKIFHYAKIWSRKAKSIQHFEFHRTFSSPVAGTSKVRLIGVKWSTAHSKWFIRYCSIIYSTVSKYCVI